MKMMESMNANIERFKVEQAQMKGEQAQMKVEQASSSVVTPWHPLDSSTSESDLSPHRPLLRQVPHPFGHHCSCSRGGVNQVQRGRETLDG